ncbi:GroES-like protein [Dendrothele bispora CBS 962.96]|uniref:GroES-like protein n=1 Tax=Dendrothele bispora (strain CBS 962.96) TaxID=1314807 RepID=A0A4S8L236_DENBC|nr:GroES-like protein [Dendrothele bispora CBS 962.96]
MSQEALLLESKFGSFKVATFPRPTSALAGEILIKVQASALNPIDWKVRDYGWLISDDNYPAILGLDIAGDVEDVGEGVVGFRKGDRVFYNGGLKNEYAGFQQYSRAPAEIVAKIPKNLTYSQASSIPVGFISAACGLYAKAPIGLGLNPAVDDVEKKFQGKAVVVIGGSTSVGQYAIQLLRYLGFSTIIAYASAYHSSYLKSLGATDFIDRKVVSFSNLDTAVKKITSSPIEIVYDALSSPDSQPAGYKVLTNGGKMVITLPNEIKDKVDDDKKEILQVHGNVHPESHREFGVTLFGKLSKLLEDGIIVPNKVEDLPNGLEAIVEGLRRLKNNEVSGTKLVSHPNETA